MCSNIIVLLYHRKTYPITWIKEDPCPMLRRRIKLALPLVIEVFT